MEISVSIKFCWNTATLTHWHVIYGCFGAGTARSKSHNKPGGSQTQIGGWQPRVHGLPSPEAVCARIRTSTQPATFLQATRSTRHPVQGTGTAIHVSCVVWVRGGIVQWACESSDSWRPLPCESVTSWKGEESWWMSAEPTHGKVGFHKSCCSWHIPWL